MAKDLISEFVGAISTDTAEPNTTYNAIVSRVDADGTVWVSVEGSNNETPTASVSSEAKKGDAVKVEWRNNKLYLAGNYTDPAAGVETVKAVEVKAGQAMDLADSAKADVKSVNQYFWHVKNGAERGAHITEVPQAVFSADPENGGGNLLATSSGIAVRDGLTELATFGANGETIGVTDGTQSYVAVDYHSMQMIDKEGNCYLYVSDLRDASGEASFTQIITTDGVYSGWGHPTFSSYTLEVYLEGVLLTQGVDYYDINGSVNFASPPAAGQELKIIVATTSDETKAFTFGNRSADPEYFTGAMSIAAGKNVASMGFGAYADGEDTVAWGDRSHSHGKGTQATANEEFVTGRYNDIVYRGSGGAFTVGNGTNDNNRSNAFVVRWDGNVEMALDTTSASGTDHDLYVAITALGWQSEVIV